MTTRAKRILFVTESREVWGAEESLLLILADVKASGAEVAVALSPGSPLAGRLAEIGVTFIEHRFAQHRALERTGSLSTAGKSDLLRDGFSTLLGALRATALVRRFDVVVPFSLWQTPEFVLACRLARRACVVDVHETFHGSLGKKMVRVLAKLSSGVISPSQHLAEEYGIANALVIPRPVITSTDFENSSKNEGTLTLGIFGQISPHKRVLELVEAVEATGKELRLLVVGGRDTASQSEYERRVRAHVDRLPETSKVIERQRDISGLMNECDFVANVSEHEAFGRTVVEAAAHGAVPLVLEGTGPAEIVRMTGVGHIFDSIDRLAQYAVSNEPDRPSRATIEEVRSDFSPQTISRRYFDALISTSEKRHDA